MAGFYRSIQLFGMSGAQIWAKDDIGDCFTIHGAISSYADNYALSMTREQAVQISAELEKYLARTAPELACPADFTQHLPAANPADGFDGGYQPGDVSTGHEDDDAETARELGRRA